MRTTSPSAAPARASARSTPMRASFCCTYTIASGLVRSASATARPAARARPLDVAQELVPETLSFSGAFDEPGDVGEHELVLMEAHDAEMRFERGERIVGNLRLRRADARDQRRLARVGKADERGIGKELE